MEALSRTFHCACCEQPVCICRRCDRGQIYCGPACRREAQQKASRQTSQKYQQTRRGKQHHAARQQRYKKKKTQKMTHEGSIDKQGCDLLIREEGNEGILLFVKGPEGACCHFCGQWCEEECRRPSKNTFSVRL